MPTKSAIVDTLLERHGQTFASELLDADWQERVDTLNRAGYARYDESTSTMLAETAGRLIDEYGGDLRELRRRTGRDPGEERRLLKDFKGLGDVGVDIFMREVQAAWEELYRSPTSSRSRRAASSTWATTAKRWQSW